MLLPSVSARAAHLSACLLLAASLSATAQTPSTPSQVGPAAQPSARPKIGLVLSGGGARGARTSAC